MEQKIFTVDEIKALLLPVFEKAPVYRAVLFGSYAKGNATEKSDLDIVIDTGGRLMDIDYCGMLEAIKGILNKPVDLFEITEFSRCEDMLLMIERVGIILYER